MQGGAGSTTASTTGAGQFMSGKSLKNKKMVGGAGSAIGGGTHNKRRGSITHKQQHHQHQAANPTSS